METFRQDLRYSVRQLARSPGFTTVALLTLALGIGANTAIFSVVNAVLLRELPFKDPDQLVWVWSVRPERNDVPFTLPEFIDYQEQSRTVDQLAALSLWSASLTGRGDAERLQGARVSANLFRLLGVNAFLGRTLLPEDDAANAPRVLVLTHALWERRFGADHGLIGQTLILNGESYAVVGVLPPSFSFPLPEAELAVPLAPENDPWRHIRNSVSFLRVVGRLKPGISRPQAEAELNSLCRRLRQQFPVEYARRDGVRLIPLHQHLTARYQRALLVLLGAVMLVLLIAAANLASLLLVRATSRSAELAIRAALGASRFRLARQLLTESILLVAWGSALGILLAFWGTDVLVGLSPSDLPRLSEIAVDASVLAYSTGLSAAVALSFGLTSILGMLSPRWNEGLNQGGRGTQPGVHRHRARRLLVVAEITLAVVLLTVAGLLLQSFLRAQEVEPGFNPKGLLIARLSLPRSKYDSHQAFAGFAEQLERNLESLPGVEAVGAITVTPMSGLFASSDFTVEGRPPLSRNEVPECQYRMITPGYRRVMQIPLAQGQDITEGDTASSRPVLFINRAVAEKFFPGQNPVGARLLVDDNDTAARPIEIVGVVGDVTQFGLDASPTYDLYLPMNQVHPDLFAWLRINQFWILRTSGDPLALTEAFRRELKKVDPDVPASNIRSMEQYMSSSLAPRRFSLLLIVAFAGVALLLAFMGVYGVVSYSVSQRTREIGLRMAIGARREDILRLILGQGVRLALTGLGAGLVAALAATRLLAGLLFAVSPTDPGTFLGVALLLAAAALLACWVPARRATKVDPMVALRYE
ncbi:MAG: ABC transporter permease [Acidobacteria bacterium]|nr:ABC transporter permease [Acidobacteriota bacterium]